MFSIIYAITVVIHVEFASSRANAHKVEQRATKGDCVTEPSHDVPLLPPLLREPARSTTARKLVFMLLSTAAHSAEPVDASHVA